MYNLSLQEHASGGDPLTTLATDLERLSDKDDESFIDDAASDIEHRAEVEAELEGSGFMAQLKPYMRRYKAWTRDMKKYCPAVCAEYKHLPCSRLLVCHVTGT